MTFTAKQSRALKAKLAHQHVKTRSGNTGPIPYLEGWYVIAEANRIFGFENWDRRTLIPRCVWSHTRDGVTSCFYTTRVRVLVRAGESLVVREGIGTGSGRAEQAELAHEIALKAAETDATKRALATFGNPFGLALYDKEQSGVTRPKHAPAGDVEGPKFSMQDENGKVTQFTDLEQLLEAARTAIAAMCKVPSIYAFWEKNRRLLNRLSAVPATAYVASDIILTLRRRLQALAKAASDQQGQEGAQPLQTRVEQGPVKSPANPTRAEASDRHSEGTLAYPKEKRVRDKAHLEYVRTKPCLICGRAPVHAHHLRFAQKRGMGMKVSDEFTVPVCSIHHDELHRTGDERAWWASHGIIEPLKVAEKLWGESRGFQPQDEAASAQQHSNGHDQNHPAAE